MKRGFTLIELLVVVLIIGILAAVALPQYEKAVEKSRAAQAFVVLKSVHQAFIAYYLANGEYPTNFDDLGMTPNWTGTTKWADHSGVVDTCSNGEWSLQLYVPAHTDTRSLHIGRLTGKYKGAGWTVSLNSSKPFVGEMLCVERAEGGVIFEGREGDYCRKIFNGTNVSSEVGSQMVRTYKLP